MGKTKIQWATKVWNPVTGCTKISEGCEHCYAEMFAKRLQKNPNKKVADKYFYGFNPFTHPESLSEPSTWKKPERVFVCSMGDLFHENIPFSFIAKVINVIKENSSHTFMILTKRPEIMAKFFNDYGGHINLKNEYPNLWLGVTAENQQRANERIPILLQIPAAIRFVSIEPMLGPINIIKWTPIPSEIIKNIFFTEKIDWIICGGETGNNSTVRAMEYSWVTSLKSACDYANIPFFFKQWAGKSKISTIDAVEYKQFPITKPNNK